MTTDHASTSPSVIGKPLERAAANDQDRIDIALRQALVPLLVVVGGYYSIYAGYLLLSRTKESPWPELVLALVTASVFLALYFSRSRLRSPAWIDPLTSGCLLLVFADIVVGSWPVASAEPPWSLGLLILLTGLTILSPAWFSVTLAAMLGSWIVASYASGVVIDGLLLTRFFGATYALAFGLRYIRVETHRRIKAIGQRSESRRRELEKSENRYRALVENSPGAIFVQDLEGVLLDLNPSVASLLEYERSQLVGRSIFELAPPNAVTGLRKGLARLIAEGRIEGPITLLTSSGQRRTFFCVSSVIEEEGQPPYILGQAVDVTEGRRAERALRTQCSVLEMIGSGQSLEAILDTLTKDGEKLTRSLYCAVLLIDESGTLLHTVSAPNLPEEYAKAIDGLEIGPTAECCGSAAYSNRVVVSEDITTDPRWEAYRRLALLHGIRSCWSAPIRAERGVVLGSLAFYQAKAHRPSEADLHTIEELAQLCGIAVERHRTNQRIQELAFRDSLTDLPNRALFEDRLRQSLALAERRGEKTALVLLDLDRFKEINDTLGHSAGDQLLCAVAARLQKMVRSSDTLARLGGDEFILVLASIGRDSEADAVATKLLDHLRAPVEIDGGEYFVTASAGIAIYPDHGADVAELMKNADSAMYRAKELGRDCSQTYSAAMSAAFSERRVLEKDLRRAIRDGGLSLRYQPVVRVGSGRIVGIEALIRWPHSSGLVSPAYCVALAERSGMIVQLEDWVFATALARLKAWRECGFADLAVHINLSAREFRRPAGLLPRVQQALADAELPGDAVVLEITETHVMESPERASEILADLKELGLRVSIDDFGVGYSSLSRLQRLPVESLKIDRSFIRDLIDNPEDAAIATAVINLAHNLDLEVIAEGVETPEQWEFLERKGCDLIQGYLVSGPLPASEIAAFLQRPSGDKSEWGRGGG